MTRQATLFERLTDAYDAMVFEGRGNDAARLVDRWLHWWSLKRAERIAYHLANCPF